MRQIYARINPGAARRSERRRVVIRKRVGINGQPIAHKRKPVIKIKSAVTFSGIVVGTVQHRRFKIIEVAVKYGRRSDRTSDSSEFSGSGKSQLQIWRRFQGNNLAVDHRTRRKFVSRKLAHKEIRFYRPEPVKNPGKDERGDPAGAKHIDRFRVVAED